MATDLRVSKDCNDTVIASEVKRLCANGWELTGGVQLEKTYHFKLHSKSVDLFNVIQVRSKSKSHHAEITSAFCRLTVRWTTHTPPGLSGKDIYMADFSDEWAESIGTIASTEAPRCG